jgi:RIO kinase 1
MEEDASETEGYTREKDFSDRIIKRERLIRNEHVREIFAQVFDSATIAAVSELARKKYFEEVEFVIATGKEGNVFRCKAGSGYYALKIYKVETSDFKHMMDYIDGDERFKKVRKDKLEIVKAWTKKEYRNLEDLIKAKVRVPLPIANNRNCLLMEFIGKDGEAAKPAKENKFKDMNKAYNTTCEFLAKMVNAKLVHSDLSEYNILNNDEELVIIDVGQMVTTTHPKARDFFSRDITNLSKWFSKNGVDTDYDRMYAKIKEIADKESKKKQKQ